MHYHPYSKGTSAIFFLLAFCLAGCRISNTETVENPTPTKDRMVFLARKTIDGKSLYAVPELRKVVKNLSGQLSNLGNGIPCRIAMSYFTMRDRKSSLGESIAQDLATLLAQEGKSSIQVFTRRKLHEAAKELSQQQSDPFDRRTAAKLGKFSGVHYILLGHLQQNSDSDFNCNCQIVDVETLEIVGGCHFNIPHRPAQATVYSFDKSITEITRRLVANRIDDEKNLRVAVFGVTRNKKNFTKGVEFIKEVSTELAQAGVKKIQVYTRHDIDQAIDELMLEAEDTFDEFKQAEIGKFVGANCVLTGFGEIYRSFYKLNLILIDVESSQIISGTILCTKRAPTKHRPRG